MPNLPSTKITIKEPKIANDIDEYVSLVKTLKNESNPKPYRIVYFYSFYDWSDSYDPYDSHEAINLAKCIHTLINTLSSAPVKHSPKRQRLLEEKANSAKKSNKASSSNGCIIC
ncbi:hypothetical protein GGI07_005109 [Coemansia sp. Benny D115]|nr:hypothetical protein GGI07_005109 [Coemansia sp. Benny D115]